MPSHEDTDKGTGEKSAAQKESETASSRTCCLQAKRDRDEIVISSQSYKTGQSRSEKTRDVENSSGKKNAFEMVKISGGNVTPQGSRGGSLLGRKTKKGKKSRDTS